MAQRIAEAITSGGTSEFNRIGEDLIKSQINNALRPPRWYNAAPPPVHGAHGRYPGGGLGANGLGDVARRLAR